MLNINILPLSPISTQVSCQFELQQRECAALFTFKPCLHISEKRRFRSSRYPWGGCYSTGITTCIGLFIDSLLQNRFLAHDVYLSKWI